MKFKCVTLGCKTNQYETNAMEQRLIEAGYEKIIERPRIEMMHGIFVCVNRWGFRIYHQSACRGYSFRGRDAAIGSCPQVHFQACSRRHQGDVR